MRVYKVTNSITAKAYIGQTTRTLEERWTEHCKPALKYRSALSSAVQKYGKENFTIEELGTADTQGELDTLEKSMIEKHTTLAPNGYNLKEGGLGGALGQGAKDKLSRANKGKTLNSEAKQKMSAALKGKLNINARKRVVGTSIKTGEQLVFAHAGEGDSLGFDHTCIHKCARGERKKHKGYSWKYAD